MKDTCIIFYDDEARIDIDEEFVLEDAGESEEFSGFKGLLYDYDDNVIGAIF